MWEGLCLALILIGSAMVGVWHSVLKRLVIAPATATQMESSSAK
jgi:hypothetical protein